MRAAIRAWWVGGHRVTWRDVQIVLLLSAALASAAASAQMDAEWAGALLVGSAGLCMVRLLFPFRPEVPVRPKRRVSDDPRLVLGTLRFACRACGRRSLLKSMRNLDGLVCERCYDRELTEVA